MKETYLPPQKNEATRPILPPEGQDDIIAEAMRRLTFEVSGPMQRHSLWGEDLIAAALLAMAERVGEIDETRSRGEQVRFLLRRGHGEAHDELRRIRRADGSSRRNYKTLAELNNTIAELEQELKRPPTRIEIAARINVSVHRVEEVLLSAGPRLSLDKPLSDDVAEGDDWGDIVCTPELGVEDVIVQGETMHKFTSMAFGHFSETDSEEDPVEMERACYEQCLEVGTDCDASGLGKDERASRMAQASDMFGAVYAHFGFVEPTAVTQKEAFVLRAKYIHGISNMDIATMLGVTASRVSQILKAANQCLETRLREEDVL